MNAVNQEVQHYEERPAAPVSESAAIISMIERAARDPEVNIDKMERLFQMHERMQERQAKVAYDAAFAQMQPELPTIDRKGKITIKEKGTEKVIQSTPYALWEDTNDAIKPILYKHGFGLSFRIGLNEEGRVQVTAVLSHREGHREETTLVLQHDSTGSKNAVQAVGSSTSYGKRYTASALLNLTSRGEDDDGNTKPEKTLQQWVDELRKVAIEEGMTALGAAWKAKTMPADVRQQLTPVLGILKHIAENGKNAEIDGYDDNYSAGQ